MGDAKHFCKNCKRDIAAGNFVIHSTYCERNIKLCGLCDQPVPRCDFDEHLENDHELGECVKCSMPVEKWQFEMHEKDECRKRSVCCKFCDLIIPFDSLSEHEESCGSRTDECSSCKVRVLLRDKEEHLKRCEKIRCKFCESEVSIYVYSEHMDCCGSRSKKCPVCQEYVKIKDIKSHKDLCCKSAVLQDTSYCKFCDERYPSKDFQEHQLNCKGRFERCHLCFKPVEIKDWHHHLDICEQTHEFKEKVLCKYCNNEIPDDAYSEHTRSCGSRSKTCEMCGENVQVKHLKWHTEMCFKKRELREKVLCKYCDLEIPDDAYSEHTRSCGSRIEKCAMCDENIQVKDLKWHGEMCFKNKQCQSKVTCEHCDEEFPFKKIDVHMVNCEFRCEKCSQCYTVVQIKDMDNHRRTCEKKNSLYPPIFCEYCELEFSSDDFPYHQMGCGAKVKKCDRCERMIKLRDYRQHLITCMMDVERSGENDASRMDIDVTEAQVVDSDTTSVACHYCNVEFPLDCLTDHTETCGVREDKCSICGSLVMFKNWGKHAETCRKKPRDGLTPCPFCQVTFRSSYLDEHMKSCSEYIENCLNCKLNVMRRDKLKHMETCNRTLPLMDKCPICCQVLPSEELDKHCQLCILSNSESLERNSTDIPMPSTSSNMKSLTIPDNIKENEFPSLNIVNNLELCPYCKCNIPSKRFGNHKKYCKEALVECPICNETYHIEEKAEHLEACDATDNIHIKKDDFRISTQNKYGALQSEENLRAMEREYENCPFCKGKILKTSYENHLGNCSNSLKVCSFCNLEYSKNAEKEHFQTCESFTKDKFVYSGFSQELSGKKEYSYGSSKKCMKCRKYIPSGSMESHLTYCRSSQHCPYCYIYVTGSMMDHVAKCDKSPLKNVTKSKSTGTVSKKKNSHEKESKSKVSKFLDFIGIGEKSSPQTKDDYTYDGMGSCAAPPSAPPMEESYIQCEYCGEKYLLDEEGLSIVIHESGCRRDVAVDPSAIPKNHVKDRSPKSDYNFFPKNDHTAEPYDKERFYLSKYEEKNKTSDFDPKQSDETDIENYSFMQNLPPYNRKKVIQQEKMSEERRSSRSIWSEDDDVKNNLLEYKDNKEINLGSKEDIKSVGQYRNRSVTPTNIEDPENPYEKQIPQQKDLAEHKRDNDTITYYASNSRTSTEPGEFLNSKRPLKQESEKEAKTNLPHRSYEKGSLNSQNSNKLHHAWKEVDFDHYGLSKQKVHDKGENLTDSSRKNTHPYMFEDHQKRNRFANESSLVDQKEDVNTSGIKSFSNEASYKNSCFADNTHYDSDPESSREMRDSRKFEDRRSKVDYSSTFPNSESEKIHKKDLFNTNDEFILSSSETRGPVKIDRFSRKTTNVKRDDREHKEPIYTRLELADKNAKKSILYSNIKYVEELNASDNASMGKMNERYVNININQTSDVDSEFQILAEKRLKYDQQREERDSNLRTKASTKYVKESLENKETCGFEQTNMQYMEANHENVKRSYLSGSSSNKVSQKYGKEGQENEVSSLGWRERAYDKYMQERLKSNEVLEKKHQRYVEEKKVNLQACDLDYRSAGKAYERYAQGRKCNEVSEYDRKETLHNRHVKERSKNNEIGNMEKIYTSYGENCEKLEQLCQNDIKEQQKNIIGRESYNSSSEKLPKKLVEAKQECIKMRGSDVLVDSRHNQHTENNDVQPMDIDDGTNRVGKSSCLTTAYLLSQSRNSFDASDPENKDSEMDSILEFLAVDDSKVCGKCGNEVCLCQIGKNISAVRSHSFSDESGDKDFASKEVRNEEELASYKKSKNYLYLKAKSSGDNKKMIKTPEDQWNKYRETTSDDDSN